MFCKQTANLNHRPTDSGLRGSRAGWRFVLIALLALQCLAGCSTIRVGQAPTVPMPALSYRADDTVRQPNLLVLLRAYGEDNTIFAKEGIIDDIFSRHLPFDVIAPNAHFGYYSSRTFETRLKEDIIDPARRQGYEHIWLAGFSMGGLGCILYLRKYPYDVDGILLTGPYLGGSSILHEIGEAGGVGPWQQTSDSPDDWERMLWSWIKKHDFSAEPPVWLGYGDDDRLIAAGPKFLAARLPAGRAFTVHGEHDLATFKTVFLHHLDNLAHQWNPQVKSLTSKDLDRAGASALLHQTPE
jgi:pimeloyl-ACP methyl ester carboxylesterase